MNTRRRGTRQADSTYFELRCSDQRVADCASESLFRLGAPTYSVSLESEGYPQVCGTLPASVAPTCVFEEMLSTGTLTDSDWATLYTGTTAWALSSDSQDTAELAHIAYRV